MKSFIALVLLLIFSCSAAVAASSDKVPVFQQANHAYTLGKYREAADLYLDLVRQKGVSANLLYDLANSYAALGDTGKAVLNYQRALRLAPGDEDIQANLEQVRKDAGLYRDDKPLYEHLATLLGADQWLLLAGAGFVLLAVTALAANLTTALPPFAVRLLAGCGLLIFLLTLPPAIYSYRSWNDAVVTDPDARLLISPFAEAASTGSIKAGRLVRPGKQHGDFVLVQDETGRSGWLNQQQVASIAKLPKPGNKADTT